MRPYILAENNWKSIRENKIELAILPWGATEAHNYHLPYATDNIQCDYIAAESARKAWEKTENFTVLPTVPFGVNTGQSDILLDLNVLPSTQLTILKDLATVLNRQRIPKLLLINGHGGNDFKPLLRELGYLFPDMFFTLCNWYTVLDIGDYFRKENCNHAGEMETSVMMTIEPKLVFPLSEAGDGFEKKSKIQGIREGWVWAERKWSQVTKDTGIGNPANASVEKGKKFLVDLTDRISELIIDLVHADLKDLYA